MSPMEPRTMEPLKARMSSGSETKGEKLSLAQSFQKASLRRGSRPAVENDSRCAIEFTPQHCLRSTSCVSEPTLSYGLVIRDNHLPELALSAYSCYSPS